MIADLPQLLERLRGSGFRDFAGTRIAARIPIAEALLNEIIPRFLSTLSTQRVRGSRVLIK